MAIEELRKIFCKKLSNELELFKLRKLQESPHSIYDSAFEIDSMINIYEALMELSESMASELLLPLLTIPELLNDIYNHWVKTSDSVWQELNECIHKRICIMAKSKTGGVLL